MKMFSFGQRIVFIYLWAKWHESDGTLAACNVVSVDKHSKVKQRVFPVAEVFIVKQIITGKQNEKKTEKKTRKLNLLSHNCQLIYR